MSPITKVLILFDWYHNKVVGTYSSLEKAKESGEEYEVISEIAGKEAKWTVIENNVDEISSTASADKVFILFDWYNSEVVGSYSSLEKAKESGEEYEAISKRAGKEAKWLVIQTVLDADPTLYSNIVYDDCYENQK